MSEYTEHVDLASLRLINRAAVRGFALKCSEQFRAGRFTRVGEDFLTEVEADAEAELRAIDNQGDVGVHTPLDPGEEFSFITGVLSDKLAEKWNKKLARLIQRKVQRQPSVGKTLSATR